MTLNIDHKTFSSLKPFKLASGYEMQGYKGTHFGKLLGSN